ncbi:MAG: hypothetical protein P8076_06490, partial [Gammaproteobacteria bacterium]
HVLSMPPAFNLSQDQTLQFKFDGRFEGDQSLLDINSLGIKFRGCLHRMLFAKQTPPTQAPTQII